MQRVDVGPGLSFSRLAYGTWRLARDADTRPAAIAARLGACLDQGITTLDLADVYGGYTVESLVGAALASRPGLRERFEIISKCGIVNPVGRHAGHRVKHYDTSAAHIRAAVEASLSALRTDRLDLLLIHRPDPFMDHHETGAVLDALITEGKLCAVGVSNFRPWDTSLLQAGMRSPLVANQIEMSLAVTEPFTNGDLAGLQERTMLPMAWSPLGGGAVLGGDRPGLVARLTDYGAPAGADAAAVALAWLLHHPAGIVPVIGTNRIDRIAALARSVQVRLTREDWFDLYRLARGRDVP